jgi:hypothetical protein
MRLFSLPGLRHFTQIDRKTRRLSVPIMATGVLSIGLTGRKHIWTTHFSNWKP